MESALIFLQHIMLTVTNFWSRSSQVWKRGWHTLHQNIKQSAWSQHWYFCSMSCWQWRISGPVHRRWGNVGGKHYTRTQSKTHVVSIDSSVAYHYDSGEFLDQITVGEGTWVAHITPEHKANRKETALIFLQHIMLTVRSFWTRLSQVKKCGWHTLHQNTKQSAWRQQWYIWSISWWPWRISGPDHSRWRNVDRTLYPSTQSKAHGVSIDISAAFHANRGEFLYQIISGEETWVAHITPEHRAKCIE